MYRVEFKHPGGTWLSSQLPSSLQVAAGLAKSVKQLQAPHEVRIESSNAARNDLRSPGKHLLDILV